MSSVPSAAISLPGVSVAPEVWEYVRKEGIEGPVRYLIEATPRLYPTAHSIKLVLERDIAIADLWFVVFEVRVPSADVPDYNEAETRWGQEWYRGYPPPRNHSIILRLIRVPA